MSSTRLAQRNGDQARAAKNGYTDALPPHDDEAERGALACVVTARLETGLLHFAELELSHFYDVRNRTIFGALRSLQSAGKPLDHVSLYQWLKDSDQIQDAGGKSYIFELPDATPSEANFPTFLETLRDRAARRAALHDAGELRRLAEDPSIPRTTLQDACRRMAEGHVHSDADGLTIRRPSELLGMTFDDGDRIVGDRLLALGQSLVIAGAGGLGKSRLLIQLAVAVITGRQWVTFETRGPELRWLILQAENSNRRLQMDLAALRALVGEQDWARVDDHLAIHTLETDADGLLSLDNAQTQMRIARAIQAAEADVVGWDSLYNFAIGDLNKDEDMTASLHAVSRLTRTGNPNRSPVVLHHALTGKAGAARATGYDRSSHGRNSKVLFAWARGQINLAPGSADSNDILIVSCGKCSNGQEFAPFAIRLNPKTMIYEPEAGFDVAAWQADVSGKRERDAAITIERVGELCKGGLTKKDLAKVIMDDAGCVKQYAYRLILKAEKSRVITFSKATDKYVPKA